MYRTILFILIFLASIFLIQCSKDTAAKSSRAQIKSFPVKTVKLHPRPFQEYLEITGTSKAINHIDLVVEEGGVLKKVFKDKGRYARKGDTLAVLENQVIRAGYDEARAALNQARLDYDSKQILYNKKAISENEFLSAQYGFERAKAAYDLAHARYDKLFIVAPVKGYINYRYYDYGAYAMPMTPLYTLVDNSKLKIRAGVAERFLSDIELETPALITFDAYPEMEIAAQVAFVSKSINPDNRTFDIEINIENPGDKLAPEMIANIKLLRRSFQEKIVVPLDALIESESGRHVFISDQQKAIKIDVKILAVYEDSVLVEGLRENQDLIILGHRELSAGDLVQVIE